MFASTFGWLEPVIIQASPDRHGIRVTLSQPGHNFGVQLDLGFDEAHQLLYDLEAAVKVAEQEAESTPPQSAA